MATELPGKYGSLWTRPELILAFDLYCRIPFQHTKATNPEVCRLAVLLDRSPAAVARKLGNFGSFDPELKRRGITGLPNAGELAKQVWDEFHQDWNGLVAEADRIREEFIAFAEQADDTITFPAGPSERIGTSKQRLHQWFFRQTVMSSYAETCCVTGITVRECLVASHIVPWAANEQTRSDPRNGVCLSATFDRLFDTGLMTIGCDLMIEMSSRLRDAVSEPNQRSLSVYHGKPIFRPQRFLPETRYLEWHRANVFQGS